MWTKLCNLRAESSLPTLENRINVRNTCIVSKAIQSERNTHTKNKVLNELPKHPDLQRPNTYTKKLLDCARTVKMDGVLAKLKTDALKSADGIPKASEGFPTPVASPPRPLTPPAAQVDYSFRNYVRKEVCFCIRIVKPLKTEKEEEKLKDKHLKDLVFTAPHPNRERDMTSLLLPGQKSEGGSQQYSVMRECSSSEMSLFNHEYQHTNYKFTLKCSKAKKKEKRSRV